MKKDSSAFVDHHGREALNFQINILVYVLVCIPLLFCAVGIPLLEAVFIYNIVSVIVAGIKANSGEMFRYPFIFRLI
jgi:uncharacterized Tic20 family protein